MCKVVVLVIKPIAFVTFWLPSPSLDLSLLLSWSLERDRSIAKARVRFPVKPEFFQVLFQPLRCQPLMCHPIG